MNIEALWTKSFSKDEILIDMMRQNSIDQSRSRLPLYKLRKTLIAGMAWTIAITLVYVYAFFLVDIWQVFIALFVLVLFNLRIFIATLKLYHQTTPTVNPQNSLKNEIHNNYNQFYKWWKLQEKLSLFVYPVAVAGGFILGGHLGSGQPVSAFLYNSKMLLILAATIVAMVPLCYWLAKKMFDYSYGSHLKTMKQLLDELDN